jgi:hypothetical protein
MNNVVVNKNRVSVTDMANELALLRSAVIGMLGEDPEGKYRSEFVRKALRVMKEKSRYTFTTKEKFLKQIS